MKLYSTIALLLLLAACACCSPPTSSQTYELEKIKTDYVTAQRVETEYLKRPWCTVPPIPDVVCMTHAQKQAVRLADYNASSALLVAEASQDNASLKMARENVNAFLAVANEP